jgi:hypothetical protein
VPSKIPDTIETLPPMGDHDIIFSEINLSLPKIKQKPHKVYQYKKANWEKIEQDLQTTHSHMRENQNHMDVNDLWNYFKNSTSDSIKKNIPTKSIGNKTTLPWVTPQIKKLINKKNKLIKKKNSNSEQPKIYKEVKSKLQKEMCNSYWNYIENMIFYLDINEPDQQKFNKQPKNL